jgi:hypothetical protein
MASASVESTGYIPGNKQSKIEDLIAEGRGMQGLKHLTPFA